MKKYIPNVLTVSRVVMAPLLVWLTLTQQWTAAVICFSFGITTNVLDGYLARRWNVVSKLGADILQPICDFLFAATAVTTLIVTGHWSIWVGVVTLAVAVILQMISFAASWFPNIALVRELKRHQSYIHPLYSAAVMLGAYVAYITIEVAFDVPSTFNIWLMIAFSMTGIALGANYQYVKRLVKSSLVRV